MFPVHDGIKRTLVAFIDILVITLRYYYVILMSCLRMIHMITVALISCTILFVSVLTEGENQLVPRLDKQFYKFWWNEELTLLKGIACDADKVWKASGKPRSGPFLPIDSAVG